MGQYTLIQWCEHTCNLWWGCEEVHNGCDHCYARVLALAKGKGEAWRGMRFGVKSIWANLRKWQEAAAKAGRVDRVFCGSMMDIFEKPLAAFDWNGNPLGCSTGDLRARYFTEVVPVTPNLLHMLLTKRPGNALKYVPMAWLDRWPDNVMTGASVSDQATYDILMPQLLRVPGSIYLSVEPLVGPIDLRLTEWQQDGPDESPYEMLTPAGQLLRLVIIGGESGTSARTCELDWIRSLVQQCKAAGVPAFVKQLGARASDARNGVAGARLKVAGEAAPLVSLRLKDAHGGDWSEWPQDLRVREFPQREVAPA